MAELKTGLEQGSTGVVETPAKLPAMEESPKKPVRSVFPAGHFARLEHCWNKGVDSREVGFCRVSPYYEDVEADLFFFAGWNGQSFQTALQLYSETLEVTQHETGN